MHSWTKNPGLLPLDSKDYCTFAPLTRAGIRKVPRQAIRLFAKAFQFPAPSGSHHFQLMLATRPYNPRGVGQGILSWRTPGYNRLFSIGGSKVRSFEELPPLAKTFSDNLQGNGLLKGPESNALLPS